MSESEVEEAGERRSPYRADTHEQIDSAARDHFGHRDYADALVAALEIVPSQFTIGLFGPWGSGKSTILGEVARRLNAPADGESAFVIFDAWRYEGDSLRREFIRSIGEKLGRCGAISADYDGEAHTRRFEVEISRPREEKRHLGWRRLAHPLLAALLAMAVIGTGYALAALLDVSQETTIGAEIAVLGALTAYVLAALNRAFERERVHETERRIEYPDQFARNFAELLDHVSVKRLVVGIDNLDRCSPERVAQILSTVKTFLEPAIEATGEATVESLCFVIAADDQALRRHLTAAEMELSVAQDGVGVRNASATVARVVQEAVDEYLRKFFNATIRITDALMEDMKAFTASELEDFVAWHDEIDASTAAELVEMAAQGLKRNPRRMKQFINNLELRLQLFAERRRAGRVQIDPDVLVVAKLAILEEEFSGHFTELLEQPRLLGQWQADAVGSGSPPGLDDRLVAFLRFTSHIATRDIRPYLSLKQTRDELDLPGYGELVGLLEDGSSEGLGRMLDDENQLERGEYIAAAHRYFDEQVAESSWSRAHNALRALVEVDSLRGDERETIERVLDTALDHPDLRDRLTQLDPAVLLHAAGGAAGGTRFLRVLETLLNRVVNENSPAERRPALFAALTELEGELSPAATTLVEAALREDSVREDFPSYSSLARARPELIGRESIGAAITAIESGSVPIERSSPAVQVLVAVIEGNLAPPDVYPQLLRAVRPQIVKLRQVEGGALLELYGALTPVLMTLPDDGEYEQLAADIVQSWEQSTPGNRWLDLDFGLELCGRSEAADQAHGDAIGSRVLEMDDDERVAKWLADNSERLPRHFRDGLLLRLAGSLVSRSEPDFAKAEKIAAGLAGPDREGAYKRACITALKASRWRDAERCLARAGRAGGEEAMRIATDCLADEHDSGGSKAKLLSFIISNQDRFDLAGRHQMAHQLVAYMIDGRQLVAGMGKKVGEIRVEDSQLRLELAKRLAEAADQQEAPRRKQHFLLAAAGLAGSDHRARQPVEERIAKLRASDDLADRRAAAEIDKQVPPISE